MNWFCSDVQCRGKYPNYMKRYFKENNIEVKMEDGDDEILAAGPVDFYTCSYPLTFPSSSILSYAPKPFSTTKIGNW